MSVYTCPECLSSFGKTLETRECLDGIRRRRECIKCGYKYATFEMVIPSSSGRTSEQALKTACQQRLDIIEECRIMRKI